MVVVEDVNMPLDEGSQVACEIEAVDPGAPAVTEYCVIPITPRHAAKPISYDDCTGTISYTYTYVDCDQNSHDWVYTYKVVVADINMPLDEGSQVACERAAVDPGAPAVDDYCGFPITPSGPVKGGTYDDCTGTISYTYT